MARVGALIPAAGMGLRLGRGHKALVRLAGRTLLERTVDAFRGEVDEIIVAVAPEMQEEARALLGEGVQVVLGGDTRQESVGALLEASSADIVLIHDAARVFLSKVVIHAVIKEVARSGAALPVIPVVDTLLVAQTGETVDRASLRAVQTPQGFRRDIVLKAHHEAKAAAVAATDDAGLVRRLGHEVALVEGSSWLMKITTNADFEMAEGLARIWDEQHP